jgi:hypothetical protein
MIPQFYLIAKTKVESSPDEVSLLYSANLNSIKIKIDGPDERKG